MFEFAAAVSPVLRIRVIPGEAPHDGALMLAAACDPGPEMIRLLDLVDPAMLDDVDRVTYLQTWERASRWVAAQHSRAVVTVAGRTPLGRDDSPREHVRVALAGIGGSPKACVDTARALAGPLAPARDALARGLISEAHTRVLAQETAHLPADTATEVTTTVLDQAPGRTPSQFRRAVRRAVITADPAAAETAEAQAATRRHVAKHVEPDGQASLTVNGPAVDVLTIWTALDLTATLKTADDPRTLDQRRFDALVALARGTTACPAHPAASPTGTSTGGDSSEAAPRPGATGAPGRRRGLEPTIYLYADAATWAGLADAPVELDGYGPIPAGAARAHFASSAWRAVVTDALTQRPLAISDTTYRPSTRTRTAPAPARPHLHRHRLHRPRLALRRRPQPTPRPRRRHRPPQLRPHLPTPPPHEDLHRLDLAPRTRRHHHLDRPHRPHLHPPPRPLPHAPQTGSPAGRRRAERGRTRERRRARKPGATRSG